MPRLAASNVMAAMAMTTMEWIARSRRERMLGQRFSVVIIALTVLKFDCNIFFIGGGGRITCERRRRVGGAEARPQ